MEQVQWTEGQLSVTLSRVARGAVILMKTRKISIASTEMRSDNLSSISRRELLKCAGLGFGGLALGFTVPGLVLADEETPVRPGEAPYPWPDRSIKHFKEQGIPNGIIHSGDPALPQIWIYGAVNPGRWSSQYQTRAHYLALRGLGIGNRIGPVKIHRDTPHQEPAFFMTAHKVGMHPERIVRYSEVERENPKLFHFASGLDHYFNRWVENEKIYRSKYERNIEEHFMQSIVLCAGRPLSDADAYPDLDEGEREAFLKETRDAILDRDYNSQLVAAWSSFMLVNHFWGNVDEKGDDNHAEMTRLNNLIELALKKKYSDDRLALRASENKYIDDSV